jgi:mutual gliding-motility protein MglA
MVFFNHATRQMTAKIVYYGPGLCGKTTNLNTIYGKTSQKARGEMVSLNTETDRTLFFDLLPMDVGVIGGFKTKLQLYTVPGQVFYNSTRKLVLKGVDGIVFVVDSQVPMLDANKESLQNLEANLRELGLSIRDIPMVFQWNKRDLKNIVTVDDLERELNASKHLSFQSNAQEGQGVFETLRGITKLALMHIKTHHFGETNPAREEPPKREPAAAPVQPKPAPAEGPISAPTPVKPLTFSDLPSVAEVLADAPMVAPTPVIRKMPAPPRPIAPTTMQVTRPVTMPLTAPLPRANAAPAAPRAMPISRPSVSPMMVSLAAPVAPKAKSPTPKAAVTALLGDLAGVHTSAMPSVIKVEIPPDLDGSDIEVVVQVRQGDRTVAQSQVKRSAPNTGATSRLTLEMKRS